MRDQAVFLLAAIIGMWNHGFPSRLLSKPTDSRRLPGTTTKEK